MAHGLGGFLVKVIGIMVQLLVVIIYGTYMIGLLNLIKHVTTRFETLGNSDTSLPGEYRRNGVLHRTNGPAITFHEGYWHWRLYGKRHRYYGPSDRFAGRDTWYIHGGYMK